MNENIWTGYPIKEFTDDPVPLYDCELCDDTIDLHEPYFDGGLGKRAHVSCAVRPR